MEKERLYERGVLNRDEIKYIAMAAMLLNHMATVFLTPGTLAYEIMVDIGYFTAITMCYFLVEGYGYTRSKRKYGQRLLLLAVVSQIPFSMAMAQDGILSFDCLNMMFTLFLCFLLLTLLDQAISPMKRNLGIAAIFLASMFSDWALLAPLFTLWFAGARGSRRKTRMVFWKAMAVFGLLNYAGWSAQLSPGKNLIYTLGSVTGLGLSGLCILYGYNGRRMTKGQNFSKWFFYWFYPAHLLILGIVRNLVDIFGAA